ncbi:hypothetical protein COY17_02880 [Candidatus Saccharibacteria bacterium CG_4_10_14_0_2_um_filter_52_9]|nr:MAG: hypothetical protein COY17_02880 [Candidatus Saccharibacteria bacterium CG_4_10_14_0_2_um_filter_52_9]
MAEYDPAQGQVAQAFDLEPHIDQDPSASFRNQFLSSGPVKALVGVAAALTPMIGAGEAIAKPMQPLDMLMAIRSVVLHKYGYTNHFDFQYSSMGKHHLVEKGLCGTNLRGDTKLFDDNPKNVKMIHCKGFGSYVTIPRNAFPEDKQKVDYSQELSKLGKKAVSSAHITSIERGIASYGNAGRIVATRKKISVFYSKSSVNTASNTKQLRELDLTLKGKRVKPSTKWY